jgi:hypothetical protein
MPSSSSRIMPLWQLSGPTAGFIRPNDPIGVPLRRAGLFRVAQVAIREVCRRLAQDDPAHSPISPEVSRYSRRSRRTDPQLCTTWVTEPPVAVRPPSMTYCAPVMAEARSEHRNNTVLAISSGMT